MRYFCFVDSLENGCIKSVSEDYIRRTYYQPWKEKLVETYGEEYFKANFSIFDCIDDFCRVYHAWEQDR